MKSESCLGTPVGEVLLEATDGAYQRRVCLQQQGSTLVISEVSAGQIVSMVYGYPVRCQYIRIEGTDALARIRNTFARGCPSLRDLAFELCEWRVPFEWWDVGTETHVTFDCDTEQEQHLFALVSTLP